MLTHSLPELLHRLSAVTFHTHKRLGMCTPQRSVLGCPFKRSFQENFGVEQVRQVGVPIALLVNMLRVRRDFGY
jgi:hypothetical protein